MATEAARKIGEVAGRIGRPVRLMEVCGTHTVSIFRHGIRSLLPDGVGDELVGRKIQNIFNILHFDHNEYVVFLDKYTLRPQRI